MFLPLNLDTYTILFLNSIFSFVFFFGLSLFAVTVKNNDSIKLIMWAQLSNGIGAYFVAMPGQLNEFLTITVANILFQMASTFIYIAIIRLKRVPLKSHYIFGVTLVVLHTIISVYATYFEPNLGVRVIAFSFVTAIFWIANTYQMKRLKDDFKYWKVLYYAMMFFVIIQLFRMIGILAVMLQLVEFSISSIVQTLSMLLFIIYNFLLVFMFVYYFTFKVVLENKHLARVDMLTGLLNRRALDEEAHIEITQCNVSGQPLSIIITDIDFFKKINDSYGHAVGDDVLRSVSKILQQTLNQRVICSRFGREEFVLILPNCALQNAIDAAEQIRSKVESEVFKVGQHEINVTMSFGVTQYKLGDRFEDAIALADNALYEAKHSGRNKVVHS